MKTFVSVDMDYFNKRPLVDLACICQRIVDCKITDVTVMREHYAHTAFGKRYKNVEIWNYDQHDDMGVSPGSPGIGSWGYYLSMRGATIHWIAPEEENYRCGTYGIEADRTTFVGTNDTSPPLPERIHKAAFFISPEFLDDRRIVFTLFDLLSTHDLKANGLCAEKWTIEDVRQLIY